MVSFTIKEDGKFVSFGVPPKPVTLQNKLYRGTEANANRNIPLKSMRTNDTVLKFLLKLFCTNYPDILSIVIK